VSWEFYGKSRRIFLRLFGIYWVFKDYPCGKTKISSQIPFLQLRCRAITFTIIGFTAIINFYNFIDASCSLIQITFLAYYLNQPHLYLLSTALIGFLYFNWAPAKIFMGDSGSTFLGAIIAITLISTTNPTTAWTALAITLPIITDAIYTLSRRLLNRENIFTNGYNKPG
jgi:UDP-N-acetylmuramyl pentapeptide phosphotransferase/UDP-N-acetylglucosamine-1-phosphate transferase